MTAIIIIIVPGFYYTELQMDKLPKYTRHKIPSMNHLNPNPNEQQQPPAYQSLFCGSGATSDTSNSSGKVFSIHSTNCSNSRFFNSCIVFFSVTNSPATFNFCSSSKDVLPHSQGTKLSLKSRERERGREEELVILIRLFLLIPLITDLRGT